MLWKGDLNEIDLLVIDAVVLQPGAKGHMQQRAETGNADLFADTVPGAANARAGPGDKTGGRVGFGS